MFAELLIIAVVSLLAGMLILAACWRNHEACRPAGRADRDDT